MAEHGDHEDDEQLIVDDLDSEGEEGEEEMEDAENGYHHPTDARQVDAALAQHPRYHGEECKTLEITYKWFPNVAAKAGTSRVATL